MAFQPVPDTARGSPPRAWGQCSATAVTTHASRFTPTGVGTITPPAERCRRRAVHPHGRGDNIEPPERSDQPRGSPPRAWGQSVFRQCAIKTPRFTPTGVGTMFSQERRRAKATVHPHGRGDNRRPGIEPSYPYGSPPRAWGQCNEGAERRAKVRFTPTGVGTITAHHTVLANVAVHPHGRGDNFVNESPATA